jgi:serine/threonine protein kinase
MYQLITSDNPYSGLSSEYEIYDKIVKEGLPDARIKNPILSEFIVNIINKATEKRPEDRFQNCESFLRALKKDALNIKVGKRNEFTSSGGVETEDSQKEKVNVPNTTAALVLGIIGVLLFWIPILGMILCIVAIVLGVKSKSIYKLNPDKYRQGSISNGHAGRVIGIVGLILTIAYWLVIIASLYNYHSNSTSGDELLDEPYYDYDGDGYQNDNDDYPEDPNYH